MHYPQAASKPPAPRRTGPWDASRSSFILSAESLLGLSYARQSQTATFGEQSTTVTSTGPSFHLFKGSEILEPFGTARLGFDGVVGPGLTIGGGVGYSTFTGHAEDRAGSAGSTTFTEFVIVPRLGFMLAPSRYVGIWLRGGVGYASVTIDTSGVSETTLRSFDLVLDPMLVITPLPHVGLLIGPSLNFGLTGSQETSSVGPTADISNKWSSYGLSAGIALLF